MKKLRIRLASIAVISAAMLVTIAAPASAATTVLADSKYQWFYWIGPVLALSFLGWLIMMAAGYYVRVLRPKWRGQKQS